MLGMHGSVYANYAVDNADLLLAFGVRFDDRVTGKVSEFANHGDIVHVDIDPSEINKIKKCDLPIVSDLKYLLGELNKIHGAAGPAGGTARSPPGSTPTRWTTTAISRAFCRSTPSANSTSSPPTADVIATGVGQHQMWAAQHYKFRQPRRWLSSSGLGTMGFGLPAAMGARRPIPTGWSSTSTATAAC